MARMKGLCHYLFVAKLEDKYISLTHCCWKNLEMSFECHTSQVLDQTI